MKEKQAAVQTAEDIAKSIAEDIGTKAYYALLEEVYTTPKPGLVDLYSCGAHTDMNVQTFEKSAEALRPWFIRMAAQGYLLTCTREDLFVEIRKTGILAEKAMVSCNRKRQYTQRNDLYSGYFLRGSGKMHERLWRDKTENSDPYRTGHGFQNPEKRTGRTPENRRKNDQWRAKSESVWNYGNPWGSTGGLPVSDRDRTAGSGGWTL